MMLLHTSELADPTTRSLISAWLELKSFKVPILPTVADELAPTSAGAAGTSRNLAATLLDYHRARGTLHTARQLAEESWWWTMWREKTSPYVFEPPGQTNLDRIDRLLDEIDPRAFPGYRPDEIRKSPEARMVCETIELEGWLLVRSDLRIIDNIEVNRWAIESGHVDRSTNTRLVYDADTTLAESSYNPEDIQQWIQAGFLACWPRNDDAPPADVMRSTRRHIGAMTLGGTLPMTGRRLLNCLNTHPDPIGLVEETRQLLPSATVNAERRHPRHLAHPETPPRPPEARAESRDATTHENDTD